MTIHHAFSWFTFDLHILSTIAHATCNSTPPLPPLTHGHLPLFSTIILHSASQSIYTVLHRRKGTNHRQMLRAYVSSFMLVSEFWRCEIDNSTFVLNGSFFSLLFPWAKISTRRSTLPTHVAACQEDYDRYVCKSFQQLVFLQHHFSYQSCWVIIS